MKHVKIDKRVVVLILAAFATLLAVRYGAYLAFLRGTSRPTPIPGRHIPVEPSWNAEDLVAPDSFSECEIQLLGIDPSKNALAYVTEKYPITSSYNEISAGSPAESKYSKFCRDAYSLQREKFIENGAQSIAYGIAEDKFICVVNFGEKGVFEVTFDVDDNPRITAEKFSDALDKLIVRLRDVDGESQEMESVEEIPDK